MKPLSICNHENQFISKKSFSSSSREINRLFSAAVVSKSFQKSFLSDPVGAAENGFSGESFSLTKSEKQKLGSIRAKTLESFAKDWLKVQEKSSVPVFAAGK